MNTPNNIESTLISLLKDNWSSISGHAKRKDMLKAAYSLAEANTKLEKNEAGQLTTEPKNMVRAALECLYKKQAQTLLNGEHTTVTREVALKPKWSAKDDYYSGGSIAVKDTRKLTAVQRMEAAWYLLSNYKGTSEARLRMLRNGFSETVATYLSSVMVHDVVTGKSTPDWPSVARDSRATKVIDNFKWTFPNAGMTLDWLLPEQRKQRAEALYALRCANNPEATIQPLKGSDVVANNISMVDNHEPVKLNN